MESQEQPEAHSQRSAQPQLIQGTNFLDEEDSFNIQLQEKQSSNQYRLLIGTIWADVCSNRKLLSRQSRITLFLVLIILVLRVLPSPLIVSTVANDPLNLDHQPCLESAQQCSSVGEGFETIVIKKINPLQRQLKYFVRLNSKKAAQMTQFYQPGQIDLFDEITWVEIYAVRNNLIYGDVIYQKDGADIYQIMFDGQPLIFLGEVHNLDEQSYLVKIYKVVKSINQPKPRQLQTSVKESDFQGAQNLDNTTEVNRPFYNGSEAEQTNSNSTIMPNGTIDIPVIPANNSWSQGNTTINQSSTNGSIINDLSNSTINDTNGTNNSTSNGTIPPIVIDPQNTTDNPDKPSNQTKPEQNITIEISVPLTVEMVRYSQFYTVAELAIRYVTFLFVLYVRSQTSSSPFIFHIILILVSNPIMFIEIAFPNAVSNALSNIFGSTYTAYLAVFLYYTHRRLKNHTAEMFFRSAKALLFVGLWIASILRQLHLVNQTKIELIQYILMGLVLLPLVHYLWKLFVFKINSILHRNMLFISLTVYYVLFLFFSGYIVNYGWKKISFYLIVQTYGIELCYLTSNYEQNKKGSENILPANISAPLESQQMADRKQSQEVLSSPQNKPDSENHSLPYVSVES